jgi:hypothetical protein
VLSVEAGGGEPVAGLGSSARAVLALKRSNTSKVATRHRSVVMTLSSSAQGGDGLPDFGEIDHTLSEFSGWQRSDRDEVSGQQLIHSVNSLSRVLR